MEEGHPDQGFAKPLRTLLEISILLCQVLECVGSPGRLVDVIGILGGVTEQPGHVLEEFSILQPGQLAFLPMAHRGPRVSPTREPQILCVACLHQSITQRNRGGGTTERRDRRLGNRGSERNRLVVVLRWGRGLRREFLFLNRLDGLHRGQIPEPWG